MNNLTTLANTLCNQLHSQRYKYHHILSDGVYIRKLTMPSNMMIMGARHLHETVMIILSGGIKILTGGQGKAVVRREGDIIVSPVGTQRLGITLEPTVLVTVHRIDSLDMREIVSQLAIGDLDSVSGVEEGRYSLYIKGEGVLDEDIQQFGGSAAITGAVQRLLPGGHVQPALHNTVDVGDN